MGAAFGLLMFAFVSRMRAHSWMRCSDYHAEITGQDYNETYCSGWMRGENFDNIYFGQEVEVGGPIHQVQIGDGQPLCQHTLDGSHSNTYKMAQYKSRQSVRVVWPAQGPANYGCGAPLPSGVLKLYMNPNVNPTEDLPNKNRTMADQGYVLVKDWEDGCTPGTDGCGFQNCPKYCEDPWNAPCFGDFVVPDVDTAGYYTFVWFWWFSGPYISCYEAYVTPEGASRDPTMEPTIMPTLVPTVMTMEPTIMPTLMPTLMPSPDPTIEPTVIPSEDPTIMPTFMPSQSPTMEPIFVDFGDDATMVIANVFMYTLNFLFVFVCML